MKCPLDGYPMDVDTDWLGRTVIRCVACDRRRAGKCQDCGKPVEGRAWRCKTHIKAKKQHDLRVYDARHREARRKKDREYGQRPEVRARKLAARKAWREAHVVEGKRAKFGRKNAGYLSREKYLAYQAEYNAKRRIRKRKYMQRYLVHPKPTCAKCEAPLPYTKGRPAKWCDAHRPFPSYAERKAA